MARNLSDVYDEPNYIMHLGPFIFLVIVAAVGTIGNLFIIGAVCLNKRLRKLGHVFVVNLAIADLVITAYIMPTGLATSQHKWNIFSEIMCEFNAFLFMTMLGVSIWSLLAIAIERYVHICKTKYYSKIFTPKLAALYIFLIWAYVVGWTCQGFTGWTNFSYFPYVYVCLLQGEYNLIYNMCLLAFGILLPMVGVFVAYIKIFKMVKASHAAIFKNSSSESLTKSQKKMQGEYRFVMTLFTIVLIFVVCWLPTGIVLGLTDRIAFGRIGWNVVIWLSLCNSSMNSIIYGVMNKNFRNGYKELLSHVCCCGKAGESDSCCSTQDETVTSSKEPDVPTENTSASTSATPVKEVVKQKIEMVQASNEDQQLHDNHSRPVYDSRRRTPPVPSMVPRGSITSTTTSATLSTIISDWREDGEGGFERSYTRSTPTIAEEEQEQNPEPTGFRPPGNVHPTKYSDIQHVDLQETML